MSVSYQLLLHDVGLRMNALVGAQFAPLETTYATATLTSANFKSADFPFSSFRDTILMAVADYVRAIASVGNHPDRINFADTINTLANGAVIPAVGSGGAKVVGVYGSIYDSSSGLPLTEQPLEVVRRLVQETWRVYQLYYFKIDGRRLYHTRPNANIEVCVYDRSAQLIAWNAAGNMPLPDNYESGVVARAVSLMTRDNAYAAQAAIYRAYSDNDLEMVRSGLTSTPSKSLSSPTPAPTAG